MSAYRTDTQAVADEPLVVSLLVDGRTSARIVGSVSFVVLMLTLLLAVGLGAAGFPLHENAPFAAAVLSALVTTVAVWRPGSTSALSVGSAELRWRTGWVENVVVRESGLPISVDEAGEITVGRSRVGRTTQPRDLVHALKAKGWVVC